MTTLSYVYSLQEIHIKDTPKQCFGMIDPKSFLHSLGLSLSINIFSKHSDQGHSNLELIKGGCKYPLLAAGSVTASSQPHQLP
jgi:hypothetical protein